MERVEYEEPVQKDIEVRASSAALWAGIFAGPASWAIDLQMRYALVSWACERGAAWVLTAISVPFFLVCCAGALLSWRGWSVGTAESPLPMRVRFMALGGLALSAIFALTILAATIPDFFLRPCD